MNRVGLGSAPVPETHSTAILNALPIGIALIDTRGLIVSTNDSWRAFAGADAPPRPGHSAGANYSGSLRQRRAATMRLRRTPLPRAFARCCAGV